MRVSTPGEEDIEERKREGEEERSGRGNRQRGQRENKRESEWTSREEEPGLCDLTGIVLETTGTSTKTITARLRTVSPNEVLVHVLRRDSLF